jgi:hypothetical protein
MFPPGQPTSLLEPRGKRKVRRQKTIEPPETVIVNVPVAGAFCLHSFAEGLPIVLMEALAR